MTAGTRDIVIDASVVAKWFYPEAGSDEARRLLGDIRERRRRAHVPDLLFAEIASVARRHARDRRNAGAAADAATILEAVNALPVRVHALRALNLVALEVSLEANCSVYDAFYVALALKTGGQLVTADERLARSLAPLYGDLVHGPGGP